MDGKRIFITGANSFIGSRLCERLILDYKQKVHVTAVVRNMGRASRIGRLPINIVKCDILDEAGMNQIIKGHDIGIHLATGGKTGIIQGTKIVAKLSLRHNIEKLIHMSSAAVHGLRPELSGPLEKIPLKRTGNPYSDAKIGAEKIVSQYIRKGLQTVILRPRIVYGPYSMWLKEIIKNATKRKYYLIDEGDGACDTIYVDNLIDAILLSINLDSATNKIFYISDNEKTTWKQFITAFATIINPDIVFDSVNSEELLNSMYKDRGFLMDNLSSVKDSLTSKELKDLLRRIPIFRNSLDYLQDKFYSLPYEKQVSIKEKVGVLKPFNKASVKSDGIFPSKARVIRESGTGFADISHAVKHLQYQPKVSFEKGVELTTEWLKFGNYIVS
jgi:nucleoside-diphosphate-sugar epimerase